MYSSRGIERKTHNTKYLQHEADWFFNNWPNSSGSNKMIKFISESPRVLFTFWYVLKEDERSLKQPMLMVSLAYF